MLIVAVFEHPDTNTAHTSTHDTHTFALILLPPR
jgi:hypothetical protein